MTARITPERVRALLDVATSGAWVASCDEGRDIDGAPYDVPCVVVLPSGAPDDDGDLIARGLYEGDAALIAAAPSIAAAYLEATAILEAARAWAAVESETPQPSSSGVGDWAERRAAARADLLAAVEAAR